MYYFTYYFRVRDIAFDEIQVWRQDRTIKLELRPKTLSTPSSPSSHPPPCRHSTSSSPLCPSFLFPQNTVKISNAGRHLPNPSKEDARSQNSPQIPDINPSSPEYFIPQTPDTLKALQAPSKPGKVFKHTTFCSKEFMVIWVLYQTILSVHYSRIRSRYNLTFAAMPEKCVRAKFSSPLVPQYAPSFDTIVFSVFKKN